MCQVAAGHAGAEQSTAGAEQDMQQPAGFRLEGRWYGVLCASQAAFLSAGVHFLQSGLLTIVLLSGDATGRTRDKHSQSV